MNWVIRYLHLIRKNFCRLMNEQAELAPLVETYTQYKKTKKSIEENLELLEEERDEEMRELLKEDPC